MKVSSVAVYEDLDKTRIQGKTTIMVDALRAGASIITAIHNGCDRIVPVSEPNEAAAIKRISEGNVILCGEVDARKVAGFDLGNSPLEYTKDKVKDQVALYATTNGSVAIRSLTPAEHVLVGTFLNATAVAQRAYELGRDVVMVCAGMDGEFSTDDIIAMGCILDRLEKIDPNIETDDLGKVSLKLYREATKNILGALAGCRSYEYLKALHLYDDLEYCTREDMLEVVPEYSEGVIQ